MEMDMNKIGLSTRSRFMIQLRILLLILLCLYFPIEIVFYEKFIMFENEYIIKWILKHFPASLSDNIYYITSMRAVFFLLGDKDMIMLYSVILYIAYHPFTAYKVIFVTNILAFINCILRLLYRAGRPFWFSKYKSIGCISSFASPAFSFFLVGFFYFYVLIIIIIERNKTLSKENNKQRKYKISGCKKFAFYLFIITFTSLYGLVLLINRINYLYQICFAQVFSMTSLFVILDLESHIHNRILNSLKNIFKIRKNKIQIIIYITFLNLLGIILYNICDHSLPDNVIYQNLATMVLIFMLNYLIILPIFYKI
jgi:hypothetical protein